MALTPMDSSIDETDPTKKKPQPGDPDYVDPTAPASPSPTSPIPSVGSFASSLQPPSGLSAGNTDATAVSGTMNPSSPGSPPPSGLVDMPPPTPLAGSIQPTDRSAPDQSNPQLMAPDSGQVPVPPSGGTQTLQAVGTAAAPAPGMTTAQWDAFTPLANMTEQQKAEYWAGQGVTNLAYGATPTGVGSNGVSTYNPAQTTANDAALAAAGKSDPAVAGVQAQQAAALGDYNATTTASNFAQAQKDAAANVAATEAAGGVYATPQDKTNAINAELAKSGFAPDGTFTGEPANNPNATPGLPANYDPTKPVAPNNGYIDPVTGKYVTPDANATPSYLVGGKTYTNLNDAVAAMKAANTATGATPNVSTDTQQQTGSNLTQYDQNANLLSTEIDPTASDRLAKLQGQQSTAADALSSSPDRQKLAQQALDAFDQSSAPQLRDQLRAVGQRAAAVGRLGMGDTATEQLQPYTDYLTQRSALEKQLASETAGQQLSDNVQKLGALNSTEGSTASQEALNRGELRSERSFQSGMDQQALENAINQWQLEQGAKNTQFGQNVTLASLFGNAAGSYGQDAGMDWSGLAQLIAPYLMKTGTAATGG